MTDSLVRFFHINSKDLVFLKFILEAYEGLAILSTEDGKRGIIRISAPGSLRKELENLLQALHVEISFFEVYPPHMLPPTENGPARGEPFHA